MPRQQRKQRIPQLRHTQTRGIGWHVSYRHPGTGVPTKTRFGRISEGKARVLYYRWVAKHLDGDHAATPLPITRNERERDDAKALSGREAKAASGSLLHVASGLLRFDKQRTRVDGQPKARGTIHPRVQMNRKKMVHDFLTFLNKLYGKGAVGRMMLTDLTMNDVEQFNRALGKAKYSASQVAMRLQTIKALIDRAGRPEYGGQVLTWNWDARDVTHGQPVKKKKLPTFNQFQRLLAECDVRGKAMIWMAVGLGFGQADLAAIEAGQIDGDNYDLRRGKTGVERYGSTPPMVWNTLLDYLKEHPRKSGQLLFTTRNGYPLVHNHVDAVQLWWNKLRIAIDESKDTLAGFYVLRHLGATEFGSRSGCSIGDIKRWLGHTASSRMADVYMKPVSPEYGKLIDWLRATLLSGICVLPEPKITPASQAATQSK